MHTLGARKAKKKDFAKDGLFDIPELWQEFMVKLEDFCPHVVFFLLGEKKTTTTTKKTKTSAPVMKCVTLAYIGVADWAGPGHRQVQGIAKCCQSHTDSSTPLSPEEDKPHRIISRKKTLECKKIYILQMYRYKKIVKHKSAIIHGSPGHDDPDPRSSLY